MSDTKSVWKKYAAAALAVVSVVGFASCGSSNGAGSDDSATSELEQVKKNGEIVFGTEGTYAPFSYHDTDDNLTGYDVEVHRSRRGTWCQGQVRGSELGFAARGCGREKVRYGCRPGDSER